MNNRLLAAVGMTGMVAVGMLSHAGEVAFTAAPGVTKTANGAKIEFAVSAPTDVAVYILDATNRVVRHLVAGALGKNPPAPLQAGALAQNIEWDGKDDDGVPVSGGPCKVRVGLGLQASYAGPAFMEKTGPNILNSVYWLAIGPDGRVYAMDEREGVGDSGAGVQVHVFRRDGSYEQTIKPYPANLPVERLKPTGAFIDDHKRFTPLVRSAQQWNFYPFVDLPQAMQTVVVAGKLVLPVTTGRGLLRLALLDLDGGTSGQPMPTPAVDKWIQGKPRLAASSDGKSVYVSGFGGSGDFALYRGASPFVARVPLADPGKAELVFGDAKQAGNDNAHLKEPRGLATDGQGHLLICDLGNNRVVVLNEQDMSFAGSFEVAAPEWIGCHPKTGAVYVFGGDALIKFSGWKDAKELYRLSLAEHKKGVPKAYYWALQHCFALDAAAEAPIVWIGQTRAPEGAVNWVALLRCEDKGDRFAEPIAADSHEGPVYRGLTADPYRREVACQIHPGPTLAILNEETGAMRKLTRVTQHGGINRLGPDGSIYSNADALGIKRWDRDGRPKPFEVTDKITPGGLAGMAGACGTSKWERDYSIDRKNDIYTHLTGTQYHGLMHVGVFGQDGRRKRTAIWGITDGGYGPRVDCKGNLYIMEAVKPQGEPFPAELKPFLTETKVQREYDYLYGSIIKFGPQGGNLIGLYKKPADLVSLPGMADGAITNGYHIPGYGTSLYASDPVALPDTATKIKIEGSTLRRNADSYVQGAQWVAPGVGFVADMGGRDAEGTFCHCVACDFDVDDFGRTFAPDAGRFRVTVLDTNGNELMHFGGYGNQDYWGPDSYVVDPVTKLLRPRKSDDPATLKSPFAEPEIAFNQIVGLAVTDRHAYVADHKNRRVLRCRLSYAIEETCEIR